MTQIREWLEGWNPGRYDNDLGEDFVVQIYDEGGTSTGLTFQLQAKSTTSLGDPSGSTRSYRLDVKDLLHWEGSVPPVVVILWDVNLRKGLWQDVPSMLSALDKKGHAWRTKGTATVEIPVTNGTDKAGRSSLRHRIAQLALPLFSDKPLTVNCDFTFPKTKEGMEAHAQLLRAINEGEEVTVGKEHIVSLKHSAWWERLFGTGHQIDSITIGPAKSDATLRLLLKAVGPAGSAEIPLALKRRRAGLKKSVFDNEGESPSVRVSLTFEELEQGAQIKANFSFRLLGRRLDESLSLLRFMKRLHEGAKMMLHMADGRPLGARPEVKLPDLLPLEELEIVEDVLEKLTFVQMSLRKFIEFDLSQGITPDQRTVVDELHSLFVNGAWEQAPSDMTIGWSSVPEKIAAASVRDDADLHFQFTEFKVSLFGATIPLGLVRAQILNPRCFFEAIEVARRSRSTQVVLKRPKLRFTVLEPSADEPASAPQPNERRAKAPRRTATSPASRPETLPKRKRSSSK